MHQRRKSCPRERGAVLIATLCGVLIASILLIGVGSYVMTDRERVAYDADYSCALDVAEAGVNYAVNQLNAGGTASSYTGTLPYGSFAVQLRLQSDPNTAWSSGQNNLYLFSTGTVGQVSRQIRVGAQASGGGGSSSPTGPWYLPSSGAPNLSYPLLLTAIASPAQTPPMRLWRARNLYYTDITFKYELYSNRNWIYNLVAKARTDTYFLVPADPSNPNGPNTAKIYVQGSQFVDATSTPGQQSVYWSDGTTVGGNMTKAHSNAIGSYPTGVGTSGPAVYDYDKTWIEIKPR